MTQAKEKVVIERTYKASIQDIWDLWTTKEGFESWWGPVGFRADVHELEARVGGALRYDMVADTPEMIAEMEKMGGPSHKVKARFTELEPRRRLVVRNVMDFLPGVAAYEADISVDFIPTGDKVRMVVTLDALHSPEFSKMQKEGFTSQLTKLDKRFAS
ncbi:MAG: SRPBCC domain-containing protein [Polyangiaceae bacterium]|nr:SRPBCC domain-containing protein [Polyangiaceae bacterium]